MLYPSLIDPKPDECRPVADLRVVHPASKDLRPGVSTPADTCPLVLSVIGNIVAGTVWLGALLLAPLWLERIVALL